MRILEFGTNEGVMWELNNKWESIAPQLLNYYYTLPAIEHAEIARQIKRYYFGKTAISRENLNALTQLVGDRLFGADSLRAAQMQARVSTAPVWYYYFPFKPAFSISSLLSGSNKTLGKFLNLIFLFQTIFFRTVLGFQPFGFFPRHRPRG